MSQINTDKVSSGLTPTSMGLLGEVAVQNLPGQTWQNVTAQRVAGTTYTNNTGRAIMVSLFRNTVASTSSFVVNGLRVSGHNGTVSYQSNITVIIPNGATYSYDQAFNTWMELR